VNNPFKQLNDLYLKPQMLPGEVTQVDHLTPEDKTLLRRIGLTASQVQTDLLLDSQIFYDRYNMYHQVEKALEHPIVGAATELYANYCCLTGDTKIPLLDGRVLTIREILEEHKAGKENWVYSCDYDGKPQPAKIVNAVKQKHTPKTFRVWLDNGKYVDASDNHKFLKRDGSKCRADKLEVGDSLMPLHRSFTENGYELVWDVEKGNWESTHKMVAQHFCDIDLKEANKGKSVADDTCLIVHHKQDGAGGFNKRNNSPSMLEVIASKEHRAIHNKVLVERWSNPEARKVQAEKIRVLNQDPEFRRKSKEGHNTPEYRVKMQPFWDGQIGNKERGAKISKGRQAYVNSTTVEERERLPREIRICAASGCDISFKVLKSDPKKYCCSGHANKGNTYNSPKKGRLIVSRETRVCALLGCINTFEVKVTSSRRFCTTICANRDEETNKKRGEAISRAKTLAPSYNHKITKIECIGEQEVYDIEVTGSHLFGLDIGIYISNTVFSPMHNATLWITSESPTYQKELTKMLDRIGIEEKIFDWAFTTGSYGDMFVKIDGIPGQGVISIDDSEHPINISRVDHNGVLIGYYQTPVGQAGDQQKLMAPWEYVHFRLLGGKKQRPQYGDHNYAEYRTVHLLTGMRSKQVTTRYGCSVLMNALAIYKRLRLAEDSLLIARLSRGLIRYIWKLKVDSCLKNDTEIALMDGTNPTIQEMAENLDKYVGKYVLTVNEKTRNLEPKQIKNVKKTRLNAQLVKVHIDERGNPEGKSISCTPDHRFMLRDGTYKEAQNLQPGDSLMPYYHCLSEKGLNGYHLVYDPGTNKYRYEHRVAAGPLKKGQIPHHKDFDKLNNDPSNIRIFESQGEHVKFHHEVAEKYGFAISMPGRSKTEDNIQKVVASRRANGKPWHSEETKRVVGEVRMAKIASGEIVQPMTDKHHSEESNEKNRQSHLGITKEVNFNLVQSEEAKDKKRGSNNYNWVPLEIRICECGCEGTFECKINSKQRFIYGHSNRGKFNPNSNERKEAQLVECFLNHKVISVEWLKEKEDTYDIEIDGTPNFPLTSGVFVHNSNMEAVGELIDQYGRVLREARSIDTTEGSPNLESRENPMSAIEDIFIPVWDDVGDLTFDKIGGETDIRWIRDIEDLRQQLAAALRTPLPLLGAWLKEATGPLGSQAIEKVDINFARMARKLQRTIRTGIKRICQIHLAYMNLDPDPNLFDVQMPEMSTAEEESLKESLKEGMDVVSSMMEVVGDIVDGTNKELDKIEIFNYLNEKILKLEDFDLKEYLVAVEVEPIEEPPIEELPEEDQPLERKRRKTRDTTLKALRESSGVCDKRKKRMVHEQRVKELLEKTMADDKDRIYQKPCLFDTDLHSYVPTRTTVNGEVNEGVVAKLVRSGSWLGLERSMEAWEATYGNTLVEEKDPGDMDGEEIVGQKTFQFKG